MTTSPESAALAASFSDYMLLAKQDVGGDVDVYAGVQHKLRDVDGKYSGDKIVRNLVFFYVRTP